MSQTFFQYGDYNTDNGAARLLRHEFIPLMTNRGDRWGEIRRMEVEIELQDTTQALLDAKVKNFLRVFSQNDKSAILRYVGSASGDTPDPNSATPHFLDQFDPQNFSGNKVVYLGFVDTDAGQLVNARTARVVIQATFRAPDAGIMLYRQDFRRRGTGGRYVRWTNRTNFLPPRLQVVYDSSFQSIVQFGEIRAVDEWPTGNIPPPLFGPDYEDERQRTIETIYPTYMGNGRWVNFGYRWRYIFYFPADVPIPTPGTLDFNLGVGIVHPTPPYSFNFP